jgi:hypothetical protein
LTELREIVGWGLLRASLNERGVRAPICVAHDSKAMALILERTATMIIGQTIVADSDATVVYSPWFPRGGNGAVIAVEVIGITSGGSLKTEIYTKNSEDTDGSVTRVDPNAGGTGLTQTSDGTVDGTFEGFEELVRAKFELSRVSGTVPVACHFRILSPSWLTN